MKGVQETTFLFWGACTGISRRKERKEGNNDDNVSWILWGFHDRVLSMSRSTSKEAKANDENVMVWGADADAAAPVACVRSWRKPRLK